MRLQKFWDIFFRRIWIIILITILATSGIMVYIFNVTPIYEANCTLVFIQDPSRTLLGDMASDNQTFMRNSDPVISLIEIIKTRPFLQQVIQTVPLVDSNHELVKPEILRAALDIRVIRRTDLISISYRNKSPIIAAKVINTLAKAFVEGKQNLNKEEVGAAKEFLKKQIQIQKDRLDKAEANVNAFKRRRGTVSIEDETRANLQNISSIKARLLQIDAEIKGTNAKMVEVQNKVNLPNARSNSFYSYWLNTLEQDKSRITELSTQKSILEKQLIDLTHTLDQLPPLATRLSDLMREEMVAKEIYTNLMAQFEEFKINEAVNISNLKILEPAIIDNDPVFPEKSTMLIKGFLLSLIFGISLAGFFEYTSGIPGSIKEINKSLKGNILGVVPLFRRTPSLYSVKARSSVQAEALRFIQSNLCFQKTQRNNSNSFLVTSAIPKDGKSTIAANLACTFASRNKKTILIDFDLRKPSFRKLFKQNFDTGVTDVLTGKATIETAVYYDTDLNLSIMSNGLSKVSPQDILTHTNPIALINKLKSQFEIIIFDTSPISLASETLEIAQYVDDVIIIVNAQKNISPIQDIELLLKSRNIQAKGFIVNKYRSGKSVYKYYNK